MTLNTVEADDVAFLHETINDPDVRAGLGSARPLSEAEEREWVESISDEDSDDVHLLVCVDGDVVGTVGLADVNATNGTAELGYYLTPDAWGSSYATDAARHIVEYAFTELRMAKLCVKAFGTNEGAQGVLEKVGVEREGVLRDHWFRDGGREGVYAYGLLESEWDDAG